MTLKDLLRVLHRRWTTAVIVLALGLVAFYAYGRVTEKPAFKARARIQLTRPSTLLTASQSAQWISTTTIDARTWSAIILGRQTLEAAAKLLPDSKPEWFANLAMTAQTDQLFFVEATGPTPEIATAVANAVVEAARTDSIARANRERIQAVEKTQARRRMEREVQEGHERESRNEREAARNQQASEDLELDVKKINEDLIFHGGRRRELDRRIAANRIKLERIRNDRSVAEHLQREGVPRLATASAATRVEENPRVLLIVERVETLHRELVAFLRKYTNDHPQVKSHRADLREAELELGRARAAALGQDIDREELAVRTDDELAIIEVRVLEPELRYLKDRAAALNPYFDRVRAAEKKAVEAAARAGTLDTILAQFEAGGASAGYISIEDPARLDEITRIELRLSGPRFWALAFLMCSVAGVSVAFVLDFVDTSIRSDYDILRHLDWATLAVVPKVSRHHLLTLVPDDANRGIANIFDTLATVLLSYPSDHPSRLFLVTGTNPQEGKTTSSINLAAALARQGKRTLLIDGDLHSPAIHHSFGIERGAGLADLLAGLAMPATPGIFIDTELPTLKILTVGNADANPYDVLDPARILPVTGQLREQFDALVIDSPPILGAGDALKFSGAADAVLFVLEAGRTDVRQATWAKRLLASVNAKVAGALLNQAGEAMAYYSYNYSRTEDGRKLIRSSV